MDYIKEVANVLDVKLNEVFDIVLKDFNDEPLETPYMFTKDKGLIDVEGNRFEGTHLTLYDLINGSIKVAKIDSDNQKRILKGVNRVEKLANMFGVKLNEEFYIKENDRKSPHKEKYAFLDHVGLVNTDYGEPLEFLQQQLIYGKATIIRNE